MKAAIVLAICVQGILAFSVDLDPKYGVDPRDLRADELMKNVKELHTAVMGIAEIIVDIDKNVRSVVNVNQLPKNRQTRSLKKVNLEDLTRREVFALKTEKLLAVENNPMVEKAKEEIEDQIKYNFLKTLSAILITGPVRAQERQQEIFKLMKATLNGEIDFKPVVDKMPFLLRENETSRFIMLLKTLRESERKGDNPSRQFGGLQNIDKILDVASGINLKEVSTFLKEIPEIFAGVESIVDGVDEYFK